MFADAFKSLPILFIEICQKYILKCYVLHNTFYITQAKGTITLVH